MSKGPVASVWVLWFTNLDILEFGLNWFRAPFTVIYKLTNAIYQYNAHAADSSIAFSRYYYAITLWSLLGLTDGKNVRIEIDHNSRWKRPTHHFAFKLRGKDGCGTLLWREIHSGSVAAPKSWELKNIATFEFQDLRRQQNENLCEFNELTVWCFSSLCTRNPSAQNF